MNTSPLSQPSELRAIFDDALRYWEVRRIPYNLILAAVVVAWIAAIQLLHLHQTLAWPLLLPLFVLAALANVLYSVAYCVDVFIQRSSFRDLWRRRRWVLWLAGTVLAVALANIRIIGLINS